ncbi:1-hydroxycarotenoid 3,4-desaturase CrtD [Methylobacterium persicinum]|uniref:1-hydroxycarotenoid 3,4-desaturase n=1 Tax=Methylobacterium persicinum TaxID=374426 RepID=A0ABU0HK28_9HYPH|nr:1-hydroxycarotenoid 3,4-desaturase CrtD [Methylobacterium persicinum]MDQ0442213.1 1-hydroxycarotenoid 3,4-desaturase [Methylobacterium persicinum]GJE40313.1 Hydroxyneurosporene desaturase [Methylobacterium persicinum]
MTGARIVVIGAGIGGLATALSLARAGLSVTVVERAGAPGGKMRSVAVEDTRIEAGPTVFTMRWVFDELLAECGARLEERLSLQGASLLARHAWSRDERLNLFADIDASVEAIREFAGRREAEGYRRFCGRAAEVYRTLEGPFIRGGRTGPAGLARRVGLSGMGDLWRIQPFATLWAGLKDYFSDPRLLQLFGRYATYCGASPFTAPATLMLVAHVEQAGVWTVKGGLSALAAALADLAVERGAEIRYGVGVDEIEVTSGRVSGVRLADGSRLPADVVVCNGDVAGLGAGLLGRAAAPAGDRIARSERSLSAVTFCLRAETAGFPLAHHTVFFSPDYRAEFDTILRDRRLPTDPTVYVCAQDRSAEGAFAGGAERLLMLVNAPADGLERPLDATEIARCESNLKARLHACGLSLTRESQAVVTTPDDFAALFPGSQGALYGRAPQGWAATFKRPGSRTKVPGLYLAGGSVHPGPGVPMAAQSGRLAAQAILADLGSTGRSGATAMRGGTSMRSATTEPTA